MLRRRPGCSVSILARDRVCMLMLTGRTLRSYKALSASDGLTSSACAPLCIFLQVRRSSMLKFISSLATFTGDLSILTTPPLLVSTLSLTESPSWWVEDIPAFIAPALETDSEKRAQLVLKWYLGTLNAQFGRRGEHLSNKSPLNPFLGELFFGRWEDEAAGTTQLISEQVWYV